MVGVGARSMRLKVSGGGLDASEVELGVLNAYNKRGNVQDSFMESRTPTSSKGAFPPVTERKSRIRSEMKLL